MLETKEQKRYLVTIVVLILILGLISFWGKPQFRYKDTADYTDTSDKVAEANAYLKYLESLKVDPKASQELFQQLLSQEDVRKEVEVELKTSQPFTPPQVSDKELAVGKTSGQQAVVDYLTNTVGPTVNFNKQTLDLHKSLFSSDTASVDALVSAHQDLMGKLLKAQVPQEAIPLQKALVSSMRSYGDLLDIAKRYTSGSVADPWSEVYKDYATINQTTKTYNTEFQKLDDKYKLASLPPLHYAENAPKKSLFIPTANALFGIGDVTITIGDIPRLIMDGIKEGLTASFSQFMGSFIQKMVQKIESNYLVANFLYYSDALVTGQYVDDYLNKYASDNLDKQLVKKFIPQFNCGQQPQDLKPLFQAKATQYLGFDPENVSPSDPNYYQKMSRVGEFMASPQGWQIYYQELAAQAASEAEKAAEKELTSSGMKSPRDTIGNQISLSVSSITSAQRANLGAMLQLGINNASSFISSFVAQLTQSLMSNFVFKGVTSSGGKTAVFKEQSTCVATAQMQLVLPVTGTQYQQPPPAPSEEDLLNQECAKHPELCNSSQTSPRGTSPAPAQ